MRQEKVLNGKATLAGIIGGIALITFLMVGLPQLFPEQVARTAIHGEGVAVHSHVMVFLIDAETGQQLVIPADIGIDETRWHDRSLDHIGPTGMAPVHTHDESGTFHIETKTTQRMTMGNLLSIWGLENDYSIMSVHYGGPGNMGGAMEDYYDRGLRDRDAFVILVSR